MFRRGSSNAGHSGGGNRSDEERKERKKRPAPEPKPEPETDDLPAEEDDEEVVLPDDLPPIPPGGCRVTRGGRTGTCSFRVLFDVVLPAWKRVDDADAELAAAEEAFKAGEEGAEERFRVAVDAREVAVAVLRIVEQEDLGVDP